MCITDSFKCFQINISDSIPFIVIFFYKCTIDDQTYCISTGTYIPTILWKFLNWFYRISYLVRILAITMDLDQRYEKINKNVYRFIYAITFNKQCNMIAL